jgi:3-hydroxyisobutyrate dehydrogenase-like beta-hydroxyacid dehydrogenase
MADVIALIGMGLLGSALAENLMAAGFPVRGYDVAAAPMRAGGVVAPPGRGSARRGALREQQGADAVALVDRQRAPVARDEFGVAASRSIRRNPLSEMP